MNLLLVRPDEISADARVVLDDRRAVHCQKVLKVTPDATLRVGVLNRGRCEAKVSAVDTLRVELHLGAIEHLPRPNLSVGLAIPRPKALSRILSSCASFGVDALIVFNAWKVEKSYLASPRLAAERMNEDLLLGLEQGMHCHLPQVTVVPRFGEFLRHPLPSSETRTRVLLHPGAPNALHQVLPCPHGPLLLVFGPDGGFIPREVSSLEALGFRGVELGAGPLRTETAVAAALGQVALLRHHL